MQPFAQGKNALGICDICGFRYKLLALRPTIYRGRKTGFLACSDCWDPEHPQNYLPDAVAQHGADPEALRENRPDPNSDRNLTGMDVLKKLYGLG